MRTPALLALLLLAACGKPLLYAEVEIPSAVVVLPRQAFPSTVNPLPIDLCTPDPAFPVAAGDTCLQQQVAFDLGNDFRDLVKDAHDIELRLSSLAIALATSDPLANLSSVSRVRVLVEGSDAAHPQLELATYERPASGTVGRQVTVGARTNVNLGEYISAGTIHVRAELVFTQDIPGFTADVTGDFYAKVLVDWGKKAGL